MDEMNTSAPAGERTDFQAIARSIFTRAKTVATDPEGCWPAIRQEPATVEGLMRNFILPAAAISPLAGFLGGQIFLGRYIGFFDGLMSAIVGYVMVIAGIFIGAFIIEKVAEYLGGHADRLNALKVVTYSMAPAMVAGVLNIVPPLSLIVALVSLYGIYIWWVGLPQMVDVAEDKKLQLRLGVILGSIVVSLLLAVIRAAIV